MKTLLSLPPNLVENFHEIEHFDKDSCFCTSDPIGKKLGSGGGTTWLLSECKKSWSPQTTFDEWIKEDKRILMHAGGQSRRLPSYAPVGKVLTPIPVFRWSLGQKFNQNLLSLQLPLYNKIMERAPEHIHTLIASGDVYIRSGKLQNIPDADVVCYGLWVEPTLAKNHGVFVSSRETPEQMQYMLQKPSVETLGNLMQTHYFLMDIGIWLLSDKAVKLLMKKSMDKDSIKFYDLYSDFGCALGKQPQIKDEELNQLSVAILPLEGGEFYHYGTSREMISSTVAIQNLVNDQRVIRQNKIKPNPALFVQNAIMQGQLNEHNSEVWIENSFIGKQWNITKRNIVTGVPENNWNITLDEEQCLDIIPINESDFVVRVYGFNDAMRGNLNQPDTLFMGHSVMDWIKNHHLCFEDIEGNEDMQSARLFPVIHNVEDIEKVVRWMLHDADAVEGESIYKEAQKLSADEISAYCNLKRLSQQREVFQKENWLQISKNHEKSVFYQLDLKDAASFFAEQNIPLPTELSHSEKLIKRIHQQMFFSEVKKIKGEDYKVNYNQSYNLLREGLVHTLQAQKQNPQLDVYDDQIVWGRSPVRIDIAGGWTDTPPYCLINGGNVVNLSIELNGQPPLQTYIRKSEQYNITLRSIDLGAMEVIKTYEELSDFVHIGSPFSIPKVALALAGFLPAYSKENYASLEEQLKDFGGGIELTLLSAIPAGSGLGTSSILASTVLGALSNFCGLAWDKFDICNRTLILEQLLTTGGGWQDQYGGVLHGLKLLQTNDGFAQTPTVRWLPETLFTDPQYAPCHLLYYTGITRVAKHILSEIVQSMFLNSASHLQLLGEMREHALEMSECIMRNQFEDMGRLVGETWEQNKMLDSGTNPDCIESIINLVKDYCLGYKLPGAGGGGFIYMIAKDAQAASKIKTILENNRPNNKARFVDMSLSHTGLQISRS